MNPNTRAFLSGSRCNVKYEMYLYLKFNADSPFYSSDIAGVQCVTALPHCMCFKLHYSWYICRKAPVYISASKAHLCARSSVFHAMFHGSLQEKEEVSISDVDPGAFYELIR